MKIFKITTAIILTMGALLLNGCNTEIANSSNAIQSSQDISDTSSDENSETISQTESEGNNTSISEDTNTREILEKSLVQDITKTDDNTLLAKCEKVFLLIDISGNKIINEIERQGGTLVQKTDKGFIIINPSYESCSYDVYDTKGNMTKHVDIPMKELQGDELEWWAPYTQVPAIDPLTLHISTDGKSVVYGGDNGFCINTIDLDNETVIIPAEDFNGGFEEFYQMIKTVIYKDDIIYGTACKFNPEINNHELFFASMNLKTKEWTIYKKLNGDQKILYQDDFVENSLMIVDAGADYKYTEGKLPYLTLGDAALKEFVCEENYESVMAYISGDAGYILTTHEQAMNDAEIKLYDVKTGEVLLRQKTDYHAQTAYIDEDARKLYVVCGTEFSVFDF